MNHVPAQIVEQDDRTWIAVSEAADFLSLSESSVFSYAAKGVFRRLGKGKSTRVLLEDIRKYADSRNPGRSSGGKTRWQRQRMVLEREEWILPAEPEMPEMPQATVFEIACSAKTELEQIKAKMTILAVRKAELEEVVRAVETIERFASLSREGTDD